MKSPRAAFTLIELLVVIAIIAVLSVVVVLSLNPAELLRQSRDANRLSDLSTLNSALALYTTDQAGVSGFSLGNASSVYVSLPDSSSTCGTWNLPTLPSGYTYACSTSTSSKNINNTGWIPVNFSSISGGAPFSNLPLDGANQSSTGLYYTYYSNGSQFITTAIPESQKQKAALGAKSIIQNYPDVLANGSNMTISPLFNTSGLMGYWPMDEGAGTSAADLSGNNNTGQWGGGTTNSSYYASGKVGSWAGVFDGSSTYVTSTAAAALFLGGPVTISVWAKSPATNSYSTLVFDYIANRGFKLGLQTNGNPRFDLGNGTTYNANVDSVNVVDGNWHHIVAEYDGTYVMIYADGIVDPRSNFGAGYNVTPNTRFTIGYDPDNATTRDWNGPIDDVRVYNRALSAAEIAALYNAEK